MISSPEKEPAKSKGNVVVDENGHITEFLPINKDQIDYAKEMIEENHPLYETPLWRVLPVLCFPTKICAEKKAEQETANLLKQNLLKKRKGHGNKLKEKLMKQGKKFEDGSPFLLYGYGMVGYFSLQCMLMFMFFLMTVLSYPNITYFAKHSGISQPKGYAKQSLGNLGGSNSVCLTAPLQLKSIAITCPTGTSIQSVTGVGVVQDHDPRKDTCYINPNKTYTPPFACNSAVKDSAEADILKTCANKTSCSLVMDNQFTTSASTKCKNGDNQFFV
jgi:hypothetical protein